MSAAPYPTWETRLLAVVTAALVVFGIAAVYGASSIVAVQRGDAGSAFALRQLVGAGIGGVALLVASRMDYHVWGRRAWPLLAVVTGFLVVLLLPFAGPFVREVNGATRWFRLGPLAFQPAEVAKFAVVAWTAMLATKKAERIRSFRWGLLPFIVILAPVSALILFEPALSTSIIVGFLGGIVLFTAGARIGHFLLLGIVAIPLVWREIATTQYRVQRWLTFWSPGEDYTEASWQIQQSLIGLGAGRVLGVGFGQGMQKLGYLPYAYSDFIYSTIGEEWGFVGAVTILALFATYSAIGLRIARTAPDPFGTLLAVGLTAMIGVTAALHMAVTLGVVPATGLPLPFISYGRTNLIVSLFATGVLISIGERRTYDTSPRRR